MKQFFERINEGLKVNHSSLYPLDWKRPGLTVYVALACSIVLGILITYLANRVSTQPVGTSDDPSIVNRIYLLVYWPVVTLQIFARILAVASPIKTIRTWISLFLVLIFVSRLYFVLALMVSLTQFQGRYVDLLLSGTIPFGPPFVPEDVSAMIGIVLVAISAAVVLTLPFAAVFMDASLAAYVETMALRPVPRFALRASLILSRLAITLVALWLGAWALSLNPVGLQPLSTYQPVPMWQPWLGAFLGLSEGDLGLTLGHLPLVGRLWADIDYGVLVSVAILGYSLLQIVAAKRILDRAEKRARHRGLENRPVGTGPASG